MRSLRGVLQSYIQSRSYFLLLFDAVLLYFTVVYMVKPILISTFTSSDRNANSIQLYKRQVKVGIATAAPKDTSIAEVAPEIRQEDPVEEGDVDCNYMYAFKCMHHQFLKGVDTQVALGHLSGLFEHVLARVKTRIGFLDIGPGESEATFGFLVQHVTANCSLCDVIAIDYNPNHTASLREVQRNKSVITIVEGIVVPDSTWVYPDGSVHLTSYDRSGNVLHPSMNYTGSEVIKVKPVDIKSLLQKNNIRQLYLARIAVNGMEAHLMHSLSKLFRLYETEIIVFELSGLWRRVTPHDPPRNAIRALFDVGYTTYMVAYSEKVHQEQPLLLLEITTDIADGIDKYFSWESAIAIRKDGPIAAALTKISLKTLREWYKRANFKAGKKYVDFCRHAIMQKECWNVIGPATIGGEE